MAIVPLKKITLIGLAEEKDSWLAPLQSLGMLHIIERKKATHLHDSAIGLPEKAQEALRYLLKSKNHIKSWELEDPSAINLVIDEVLENKQKKRELEDLRDDYLQFIAVREEWGDFHFPPIDALGGFRFWFYIVPKSSLFKMKKCLHPWQAVGEKHGKIYLTVLCQHEPTKLEVPFTRVRTGYKSLSRLKRELDQVERELDENQLQRTSLTRWIMALSQHLNAVIDRAERSKANCQIEVLDELSIVQGWVPKTAVESVTGFAELQGLACLTEAVGPADEPPTLLKTHPLINGAKAAVQFFQIPGYRTWDPSFVVFVSFNLFFAMILSDAGYAALCAAILLLYRKRIKAKSLGVYRLLQALTLSALAWGVIVGSYFGISPSSDNPLSMLRVVDMNDFDLMINISVAIGVLHLVVANFSSAMARNDRWLALADIGWAAMFISGLSWFLWDAGRVGLVVGLCLVFLFSSHRPWRGIENLLMRLLDGLKALTGFSKGFGDVLSYMRLFALGLSSAQLAITFNGIAQSVMTDIPGLGVFLGILILLVGHLLNLALGIMGGVIHGLRLNLIEFLNWGVKAEGYAFKPFAKQEDVRWKQ